MINKITSSIKNNPIGAAVGAGLFFLGAKKFLHTGWILSGLIAVGGALVGSGVEYKLRGSGFGKPAKIVVKQEDATK